MIPISLGLGLGIPVATHGRARAFLSWWRARREEWPVLALRGPHAGS